MFDILNKIFNNLISSVPERLRKRIVLELLRSCVI